MSAIRFALAGALLVAGAYPMAAQTAPRFLYIYRDSLRAGADSAFRAIENDGAQICADLTCPNPYIGLESLSGQHEAWWINAFATDADTARVAHSYATRRELSDALGVIGRRKEPLIGKPIQGFAVYRPDLSRGPAWPVAGARFLAAVVTRTTRPVEGSVWEMDSILYVLRLTRTRREAASLAGSRGKLLAIRPNWSMPARDWVAADSAFWRGAPRPKSREQ